MFQLFYSNQALKFLKQADRIMQKRALDKLEALQKEPFPRDAKRVEGFGEKLFRVRMGDVRILYEVEYGERKIGVVKIDKRSRVY